MDQLKASYDRFLLIAASLGVLAATAFIILQSSALTETYQAPAVMADGEKFTPDEAVGRLRQDHADAGQGQAWKDAKSSLFVSRVYLVGDGKLVDILEGDTELFPGIPNKWILEHNLDYTSKSLPEEDADNDGFTNLEEFMVKTNPRDPSSTPPLWTKLRVVASKIDKLRTKFTDLPDGNLSRVSINTISSDNPRALSGSTKFYRPGDVINLAEAGPDGLEVEKPTRLKFDRAEMRKEFNPTTNTEEQVPVIILRNTTDGMEIELRRGEVKDSPYSLATLRDNRTGQEWELRTGDDFELPGGGGKYKLIDVTEEKAEIKELGSGAAHTVPRQTSPPSSIEGQ
jgi:hypothetical protein